MAKQSNSPRRLLQFSLRTLLGLMTVVAVCLGTWLDRGRQEQAALDALQARGYVGFAYDYQWDANGNWVKNPSPPGPEWVRDWMGENCVARIVKVSGYCSTLDDEGLSHVAEFRQLRMLHNDVMMVSVVEVRTVWSDPANCCEFGWRPGAVTNSGIAHLNRLTRLETLVLVGTVVSDDGLVHLSRLRRLKRLKISSPYITDKGIPHFLKLTNLEALCVSGTSISETGVAKLRRGLPNCKVVGPEDVPEPEHEEQRLGIFSP